jgi:hypothetical protein
MFYKHDWFLCGLCFQDYIHVQIYIAFLMPETCYAFAFYFWHLPYSQRDFLEKDVPDLRRVDYRIYGRHICQAELDPNSNDMKRGMLFRYY